MRVVVTGASSVLGRAVVAAVRSDKSVDHVIVLDRTDGGLDDLDVEWARVDAAKDDLQPWMRGVDAVIHLASAFPSRVCSLDAVGESCMRSYRVRGRCRRRRVGALLYGSSFAVYSPVSPGTRADESWGPREFQAPPSRRKWWSWSGYLTDSKNETHSYGWSGSEPHSSSGGVLTGNSLDWSGIARPWGCSEQPAHSSHRRSEMRRCPSFTLTMPPRPSGLPCWVR